MFDDENVTRLLVKLNRLTSQGILEWEITDPPRTLIRGTNNVISLFMTSIYRRQHLALYEQRYEAYDGDHERYYWSERVVLAILDRDGRAIWQTFEGGSALFDLFETARRKAARVDDLLNDLLVDDENDGD